MQMRPLALALAAAGLFTACSGGGSDSAQPVAPPTPVTGVTLAGVVAKGAALDGASVTATCATGSGTATTGSNGSYNLSIPTGNLPCVLEAVSSDKLTKLHSVAPANSTGTVTANVTPLTELVVAQLTGADPATYVVVPGSLATLATASAVSAAQTAVASTLTAGGVSTTSAGDFISGTLVAANGSTAGNAYDVVLDALNAKLVASGTTLATLTTTIAASSPAAPPPTPTTTADSVTLPADLLLKPKAPNCASLASGSYRVIKLAPSPGNTVTAVDTADLDAPTLKVTFSGSSSSTTWTANGNCRYTSPDGADIVVSPAGVLVALATIGLDDTSVAPAARGTTGMAIGLPVQTIALPDLAGTWNTAGWSLNGTDPTLGVTAFTATVASSGAVTQAKCGDITTPESSCPILTSMLPAYSANSSGGFNRTSTDPLNLWVDRAFAYRAGNGELMLAGLAPSGEFFFWTKARTLTLPAVGIATASFNLDVRVTGLASNPVYYRNYSIASVNSAAGTLLRNVTTNGGTVAVPETLEYNKARNGYFHRPAATPTASDGSTATVREAWVMPLRGFGITPYALPATSGTGASSNAIFGLSVSKQP